MIVIEVFAPGWRAEVPPDANQDRHVMTLARIVRRKAARLARRSWAGGDPARLVDLNPCSKATAKQWLNPLSGRPDTLISVPSNRSVPANCCSPKSTIATMPAGANFPIAPRADAAPPPAISCLGASRTPAVGACGEGRHAGVREPAQFLS
jgi:hypothetical protein